MKTLNDYFNESTYSYVPTDKIIEQFSKDEIFEYVDMLNEKYKQEIKEWQWMDYREGEFNSRFVLIDKISAFQDLKRNYDKFFGEAEQAADAKVCLSSMLESIDKMSKLLEDYKIEKGVDDARENNWSIGKN